MAAADYEAHGAAIEDGELLRGALVRRTAGALALALALFGAVSLLTWSATDPNVNHAVAGEPENWLGWWGASFADTVMQLFGLAGVLLLLVPLVWGWRATVARRTGATLARGGLAFAALVLACAAAACIAPPEGWPLETIGIGGVFGDAVIASFKAFTGRYPSGLGGTALALAFLLPAVWLGLLALGRTRTLRRAEDRRQARADMRAAADDEEAEGHGLLAGAAEALSAAFAATMGFLSHVALATRATVSRRVGRTVRARRRRRADAPMAPELPVSDAPAAPTAGIAAALARAASDPAMPEPTVPVPVEHDAFVPASEPAFREPTDAPAFREPSDAPASIDAPERIEPQFRQGAFETGSLNEGAFAAPRVTAEDFARNDTAWDVSDAEAPGDPVWQEPEWRDAPAAPASVPASVPEPAPAPVPAKFNRYASGASGITAHRLAGDEPTVIAAPSTGSASPAASAPSSAPALSPQPAASPAPRIIREAPQGAPDVFAMPGMDLLAPPKRAISDPALTQDALEQNARTLEGVLADYGVKGAIINVRPGPVVTLYELEPAPGIKSSRVIGLAEDIARSMEAIAARVAVIPGRNAIGIELPNRNRETVYLAEQLQSGTFNGSKAKLAMALGKTIGGEPVVADLAKMPHLLVAGTTGSGKSVAINTMILSLLYRHRPDQVRLIMVDPKMVELSVYDGIPHLLTPVVTDPKKAVVALKWTVREMEQRYSKMSKVGVRNVDGFNTRVREAQAKGERITRTVQTGFDRDTGEAVYEHEEFDLEPMPFIVVIIDEVADLMMVAGKEIEGAVQRLGQMARAAGIHVIMATQRPSTDVITGTIKANFPTRMSFQVTTKIDSRVMLGEAGAEQLLGMGDMLHMAGGGRIERVHGPFVSDDEVEAVVAHLKLQGVPDYLDAITQDEDEEDADDAPASGGGGSAGDLEESDDPYDQAVAVVLRDRKVSTSYIQRRLGIGYNRAASLIERMEKEGVIGPANHAGKREILVPAEDETI